jgi:ABC-type multidrug transport system ATPase subunit
MTVQAAIEARAVGHSTRAGEVTVRDVSLTVRHGELVAIIGGIGSGKTTLLDALSGLRPPTSGTVARGDSRRIGYVPSGDSNPPVLPLAQALRYTAALRGVRGRADAVNEVLAAVGLTARAAVPAGALDPGERKRADIAAELLPGPAELFLDEPTADLDPAQATQVLRLLRTLADDGVTVVLTTSSAQDAVRCDKVAVLAVGGHLAFYGTPAAASGYFGADSLEEVYERLAGLGDPAAAWSRRFLYLSRTSSASTLVPTTPPAPGPALLVPDLAGPHSAGRPSAPFPGDLDRGPWDSGDWSAEDVKDGNGRDAGHRRGPGTGDGTGAAPGDALPAAAGAGSADRGPRARPSGSLPPVGQLAVLIRRNAEALARNRRQRAIVAGSPVVVLLVLCVLLAVGALDGPGAVTLAWAVLGGLAAGLAYQLPARGTERGVLRRERFAGLSTAAFVAAKAAVLLPVLAVADVLILAVPAIADRLQAGFGLSYLAVFLSSAIGLAAATAALFLPAGAPLATRPTPPGIPPQIPPAIPPETPPETPPRIPPEIPPRIPPARLRV